MDRMATTTVSSESKTFTFSPDDTIRGAYENWLRGFDARYLKKWRERITDSPEASMCEATFWNSILKWGISIEPNEDLDTSTKRPDFRCQIGDNVFFVEVSCLEIEKTTELTGLPHVPDRFRCYATLNEAIRRKCKGKVEQCAAASAPTILAIGTFHFQASVLCFDPPKLTDVLLGESRISLDFDPNSERAVGPARVIHHVPRSAFIRAREDRTLEPARRAISAILLGGFGCVPHTIVGLLHPDAVFPFDPSWLKQVDFYGLSD
jgi:hypothetical protein